MIILMYHPYIETNNKQLDIEIVCMHANNFSVTRDKHRINTVRWLEIATDTKLHGENQKTLRLLVTKIICNNITIFDGDS